MNIKITCNNLELTPAIDDYVHKKISLLEKFLTQKEATICEVEIGKTTRHHKSGDVFKAEVNLIEPGSKQVYAVVEEEDLYAAIEFVRDEVEREIISNKEKRSTLVRKGGALVKSLLKNVNNWRRRK